MSRYILKRIGQSIIVLLAVTIIVFLIIQALPGDPIKIFLGESASQEQIDHYTKLFGFDQPVYVQYFKWVTGLFQGEMGLSVTYSKDISEILPARILATLSLSIPAFILSVFIGVLLGILSAYRRGKFIDSLISAVSNIGLATPQFFLGIIIILLFALKLKWIPVQGYTSIFADFGTAVKQLTGPVLVLAIGQSASFARQTRSAMLEEMGQDYMRTARSKGVKENAVIIRHGLRNALIPLVTVMGMAFGRIVGGAVIIENLFSIPGIGQLLTTAINNSDYFVVEDIVFLISLFVIACNLIVDILYGILDPRIRVE